MKVSIITVSYNAVDTIEQTIKSVLEQDHDDLEYVVIDGDSKDGTTDIIKVYAKQISNFVSEPDNGIYDAMNKGIANCQGDVIGILNADDVYTHRSVISKIVHTFNEHNTDAVYGDLQYVAKNDLNKVIRYWRSRDHRDGDFKKGWMPPHPSFFLKKEIYDDHGTYRTDLHISADYELMLRMFVKHGISSKHIPEVITKMRVGGESNVSLKNRIKANKEDRLAWKLNDLDPGKLTLIKKPLRKIDQFWKKA
ncbi:MAG: glycosyltransferase [Flavobacteriales bacterium]|nr:glycosyltransferase [Flavobacteriales bacterium]